MIIENIKIKNYKGFEDCSVDFHPNVNVFIGSNASGKTTLLEAVLKSIYFLTHPFAPSVSESENLNLKFDDINYNATSCKIQLSLTKFPKYNDEVVLGIECNPHTEYLSDIFPVTISKSYENFANWLIALTKIRPITIPIV
ncbi:MAG: AAA family ATPase, partial [Bacteroidia bacterium]|nr:AAA family ATPase [Bacteroidia bacterium]